MEVIKHKGAPLNKTVETQRLMGKKVLSKDGVNIGEIRSVHIHPTRLTIEGIRIRRGLFKGDDYIGKNYIKSVGNEGAVLKITPIKDIIGASVYDVRGRRVGKVRSIKRSRKTNNLEAMSVRRGFGKKEIVVSRRSIKEIGRNVMLRISVS